MKQYDLSVVLGAFWMAVIVLAMFQPEIAAAAGKYGPGGSLETDMVGSARDWWRLIANVAVIGGIIAAIVLYFFYPKYLGVAVIIAMIGGFGESVVNWILTIGGGDDFSMLRNR
jgi:hypothetical protein